MMDALSLPLWLWVLVGIGIYWASLLALRSAGYLPEFIGLQGPIITVHTQRGRAFLDRLARPRRFWRAWANFGVGIALVVMACMFLFLLIGAVIALSQPQPTSTQQPQNVLVIPGVNEFLPLSAAPGIVFGLLVGLVVHEGGHGLLCRVEDIDIDSMGVALLAAIPIGAFVEPDEESSNAADRGAQTRMFAAGVTNNFAISIVAFALLFGPIAGSIGVASGAAIGGVAPGSPASEAGIEANDRITAVNGDPIADAAELEERLAEISDRTVSVEIDGERTTTLERSVLVTAAAPDGPTGLETGDRITAIDGTPVYTRAGFQEAIGEAAVMEVTIDRDGETIERTAPIGSLVVVAEDGPLSDAGAPPGEHLVITRFDGERVPFTDTLDDLLADTEPGQTVTLEAYAGETRHEYTLTLDENPRTGSGFVGIGTYAGTSGVLTSDLGVQFYPAGEYLALVGGDTESSFGVADSFLAKIGIALFLPIVAVIGLLPFNFAGFTGGIENFYEVQGVLAAAGEWPVFLTANLLFWTGWINVQLGFFNCIPAFPLDGGHIFRSSTEAVVSRLPGPATRGIVRTVTTAVGLTMLVSFLLLVFGPQIVPGI